MSQQQQQQRQYGKVTPNLDQESTKHLNLTVLRRTDPFVEEILFTASHVAFYEFDIELNQWNRKDVEGTLFVVKRNKQPRFQFIVLNRRNTDNLVENLLGILEYEVQKQYLLYRNASQEINGIWFYDACELEGVVNLLSRIHNAYLMGPQESKVTSTKGEFEELEAVSTMGIMDAPLEPSSSTASIAAAVVPNDPAVLNFFSRGTIVGRASSAAASGRPYPPSIATPAPSNPTILPFSKVPPLQQPSPPSSSTPLMPPLLDNPESSSNIRINLVKPSAFFVPPPASSAQTLPPVSTSLPNPSLVNNPPLNQQHSQGTPLLQPLPPPTPSSSLSTPAFVPTQNYGPNISREKVQVAFATLVKDNQFIDMVHRALANAHLY